MNLAIIPKGSKVLQLNDALSDNDVYLFYRDAYDKSSINADDITLVNKDDLILTLYHRAGMYKLWHLYEVLHLVEEPIYEYNSFYDSLKTIVFNSVSADTYFKTIKICILKTNYTVTSKRKAYFLRMSYIYDNYVQTGQLNFNLTEQQNEFIKTLKRKDKWSEDEENHFRDCIDRLLTYAPDLDIELFFKERQNSLKLEQAQIDSLFEL